MLTLLIENLGILTTLLGGGLGWFLGGRQKQDIENKQSNTDAVKSMSDLYGNFLEEKIK